MSGAMMLLAASVLLWPARAQRRLGLSHRRIQRASPVCLGSGAATATATAIACLCLPWPAVVAAVAAAATGVLRWRRRSRRAADLAAGWALTAGLDIVVAELRIGASPVAAFSAAAADSAVPVVARGLGSVAARASLGADVSAGLLEAGGSALLARSWERLAVCWRLAGRHGLPVAALMRAAQRDIGERRQFAGRVSAALAGTRATAVILAGLPLLGLGLGQSMGAEPLRVLTHSPAGATLLLIGVSLGCLGLLWTDRIVAGVIG